MVFLGNVRIFEQLTNIPCIPRIQLVLDTSLSQALVFLSSFTSFSSTGASNR
jgi:hypothetical protein